MSKWTEFTLNQRVRHIPSGAIYVVVGTFIDGRVLIDDSGEGIIRAWVLGTDLEAVAPRARTRAA